MVFAVAGDQCGHHHIPASTEDRATQKCDPSADPGAETGVRIELKSSVRLPLQPLRFWSEIAKLSRQDAATAIRQCAWVPIVESIASSLSLASNTGQRIVARPSVQRVIAGDRHQRLVDRFRSQFLDECTEGQKQTRKTAFVEITFEGL